MEYRIVEVGCDVEIKVYINDIPFYTAMRFDTKEQAKEYLLKHDKNAIILGGNYKWEQTTEVVTTRN